jgi:hypothetical protein
LKLALRRRLGTSITCTDPSPWQATNSSSPWNAMSIGSLPTLMAACCRNGGSTRLKRVFAKVGVSRQSELAGLLTRTVLR